MANELVISVLEDPTTGAELQIPTEHVLNIFDVLPVDYLNNDKLINDNEQYLVLGMLELDGLTTTFTIDENATLGVM